MKTPRFLKAHMRELLLMLLDAVTVTVLYTLCFYISRVYDLFDFRNPLEVWGRYLIIILSVYLFVLFSGGVYRSLWSYAQSREYFICTIASMIAGMTFFLISRLIFQAEILPFYFYLLTMCTIAIALVSERLIYRVWRDYCISQNKKSENAKRVLVVGCGDACQLLLNEIAMHPDCGMLPVVAVDNDAQKVGKTICGVNIEGTDADIGQLCKKHSIDLIIVAIPSADNRQRAAILDKCASSGCEVKMLPRLTDFYSDNSTCIQKLRDITPEELLGREPVNIDNCRLSAFLKDKCVMVTGGGGSIGSELCRQIAAYAPSRLVIVDIYENNAYDIQQELLRKYHKSLDLEVYIASVRDYDRMLALMNRVHPDLVIHAAAHKHVPLMETSPAEAVKNNIFGTLNTARAAIAAGVSRFVLISTDKAVNPTNFMGATKRICELIIEAMNGQGTLFSAVRFGNVLGSNGSVIPLFKKQIEDGGPVTVTHEEIIRYFMTIPEAVELVLASASMAQGGEIFVLDMGEPVKILDLAKKMINLSGFEVGKDIEIKITGLRPGEKLYEELLMSEDGLDETENGKIHVGRPGQVDADMLFTVLDELKGIAFDNKTDPAVIEKMLEEKLCKLIPTFRHNKG